MKTTLHRPYKLSALTLSIASALFTSTLVQAQDNQLEEIQITGTRIRTTDGMVQPTPVTAVTTAEMQNFDPASSESHAIRSEFARQRAVLLCGRLFKTEMQ
jgi:hypothetical protein